MVLPYGCIDLVFRKDVLEKKKKGLSDEIIKKYDIKEEYYDNDLILVACAMNPWDAETEVDEIEKEYGLTYLNGDNAVDFTLVEGMRGPCARCDWLKVDHLKEPLIVGKMRYPKNTICYEFIKP